MKFRQGFVSNSSTSSFIAVLEKKGQVADWLAFVVKNSGKHMDVRTGDPSCFADELECKKEDEEKVVPWLEKEIETYKKLLTNEGAQKLFVDSVDGFLAFPKDFKETRQLAFAARFSRAPKEMIQDRIDRAQNLLHRAKLELESLNRMIDTLRKYPDDKWQLIKFEEDAMWGFLGNAIEELAGKDKAVILQKETS